LRLTKSILQVQWLQFSVLTFIHFYIDMVAGILPVILPAIRKTFEISLTNGVTLLTVFYLTCNIVQMFTGHMRPDKKRPFFLIAGPILASSLFLLFLANYFSTPIIWMFALVIISGIGIAVVHPEGLRAIHLLRRIKPSISTAFFLNVGFIGICSGGVFAAVLVYFFGLKGLLLLFVLTALALVLIFKTRLRLAVDRVRIFEIEKSSEAENYNFWLLFLMAVPLAASSTIIASLIPTCLSEFGYELYFGSFPAVVFGIGGMLGSLFWARLSNRKGEMQCSIISSFIAAGFFVLYLINIKNIFWLWALGFVGFCAFGSYSLIVTLARKAKGTNLGRRMSFIIGGAWASASLIFMAVGAAAEHVGLVKMMNSVWVCYLLAGLIGLCILKRRV